MRSLNYIFNLLWCLSSWQSVAAFYHSSPLFTEHSQSATAATPPRSARESEFDSAAAFVTEPASRRDVLVNAASAIACTGLFISPLLPKIRETLSPPSPIAAGAPSSVALNLDQVVELIGSKCNRKYLHNIVASDYNFLYRGVPAGTEASIRREPCDLLDFDTYGSDEAVRYFAALEKRMESENVKPSNGHLATTSAAEASGWGSAASIWPLGEDCHFAWFATGGDFYPGRSNGKIVVDGLNCGELSLDDVLNGDTPSEVMFSTPSDGFLVVPSSMDDVLRKRLRDSFFI